ncbi:uncharacterized protein TNCV_4159241 [Trichonephila clavipes]|nr:uncharacterized protein TNCV_4159241 [Trichonephila clavipes]
MSASRLPICRVVHRVSEAIASLLPDFIHLPVNREECKTGRFDLSTFRSERTNEASTLTITPKRSSSRDVGTSSYRYHTATYPLPVFRRIGERTIPYLWRACKQLRHFVGCVIVLDGLRIASFVLDGFEK